MKQQFDETTVFHSATHGNLTLLEVTHEIELFLSEQPNAEYALVIGSDSHEKVNDDNKRIVNVVSAIVVHRKGTGGKYFWFQLPSQEVHSLREKIYAETSSSLSLASEFVPVLKKTLNGQSPKYYLEIHVDVGEHGETREMIKEVVGMITGSGFVAKTKPYAYGASYVADKHT